MKFIKIFLVLLLCSCDGGEDVVDPTSVDPPSKDDISSPTYEGPYCGDRTCDADESYWTCLDCVDPLTGGPKNGYCGDGVCFNETMLGCWRDCRPKPYNPYAEDDDIPHPGPKPGPLPDPIPGPDPGPFWSDNVLRKNPMGDGYPLGLRREQFVK